MANKITTVVDFVTDKAGVSLRGLKQSIDDAEGAGGKLKAGFKGVSDGIQANAGALAIGAGGALVAFGIKAVGAFEDTAKAAIDLGAATGLGVEDASRWIGVAEDFRISADDLQSSVGKIGKTLDGTSWDKYGIATRDAGGNARNTNDILIDALSTLSDITNETARAKAGNELFGRGWAKIAPLVGHTKDEYEKMLGSVEKGQVITEEEAKKAERMRRAQDDLHDALQEVTLALGGVVAEGAPLISFLADAVGKVLELKDALDGLNNRSGGILGDTSDSLGVFEKIGHAFDDLQARVGEVFKYGPFSTTAQQNAQDMHDHLLTLDDDLGGGEKSWEDYGSTAQQAVSETERETRNLNRATGDLTDAVDLAKRHSQMFADDFKRAADTASAAWDALEGNITDEQTWISVEQGFQGVKDALKEAGDTGGKSAEQIVKGYQDARLAVLRPNGSPRCAAVQVEVSRAGGR